MPSSNLQEIPRASGPDGTDPGRGDRREAAPTTEQAPESDMPLLMRLVRYGAVGLSGVGVNLGALWLLSHLPLPAAANAASIGAIELSILWNFVLHDRWTFGDRHTATSGLIERLLRFHAVAATSACLQLACFVSLNMTYACATPTFMNLEACGGPMSGWIAAAILDPPEVGAFKFVSQATGIAFATALNFLLNLKWTFRVERSRGSTRGGG